MQALFFIFLQIFAIESLFPFWPFFYTSLDFSELPCYTITRCKTRKTKVLQGFRRFPA